ncbi:MAG: IS5 family transposase [Candidatus Competibacteraceae bacterium]|nr:IS5 family transposase [Candidatus Competibacteraceae bacterium]
MAWPKEEPYDRYPSDLTDEEWEIIKPILEQADPYTTGRPRTVDLREVVNAIFYLNKTGCQWRYLPKCFPSYTLVSYYHHQWVDRGILEKINTGIRQELRKELGRNENPSAGIIDRQTVKGTEESARESGFDGGKVTGQGRKRLMVVDTRRSAYLRPSLMRRISTMAAPPAKVLTALFAVVDTVKKIWADGAYVGEALVATPGSKRSSMVFLKWCGSRKRRSGVFKYYRSDGSSEEAFAPGLVDPGGRSTDYEPKPTSSAGHVYLASSRLPLRRIRKERALFQESLTACLGN